MSIGQNQQHQTTETPEYIRTPIDSETPRLLTLLFAKEAKVIISMQIHLDNSQRRFNQIYLLHQTAVDLSISENSLVVFRLAVKSRDTYFK